MTEGPGSKKSLAIVAAAAFALGILAALSITFLLTNQKSSAPSDDEASRYATSPHSPGRGVPEEEQEEAAPPPVAPGGPAMPTDRDEARRRRRADLDRQAEEYLDRFSKMMNRMLHGANAFGPQDKLFKDLEEMEKKFYERMEQRKQQIQPSEEDEEPAQPGGSVQFFSTGAPDVTSSEDENNYYFDVTVEGYEKDSVKIRIDENVVTVQGRMTRATGSGDTGSGGIQFSFSSSFERSFPVPPKGDASKAEMSPEKGKIVVKIPKKKG